MDPHLLLFLCMLLGFLAVLNALHKLTPRAPSAPMRHMPARTHEECQAVIAAYERLAALPGQSPENQHNFHLAADAWRRQAQPRPRG